MALQSAKAMPVPEERSTALAGLARQWLEIRPDLAERALREVPVESGELPGLVDDYLATVLAHDVDEAHRWVDSLEDPALHELARQRLIAMLPDGQLADSATAVLHPGRIAVSGFDSASEQFLHRWSAQDPASAAAWLARMPVGAAQDSGLNSVAGYLVLTGPQGAADWLQNLPSGRLRSAACESMAAALAAYPEPLREGLLGPPESPLRELLHDSLASHLPPPPVSEPDDAPGEEPYLE